MPKRKAATIKLDNTPLQVHKTETMIEAINKVRKMVSDPVISGLKWGWMASLFMFLLNYYIENETKKAMA